MMKRFRRNFAWVLVTAMLVNVLPDMTDNSIVYAEDIVEAGSTQDGEEKYVYEAGGSQDGEENDVHEKDGTQDAEDEVMYYETNLKVKALPIAKNIYTGQRDIQIATPIFSHDTTNKTVVYLEDDKNQIITNNYGGILGNAYDPDSQTLVINIPKNTSSGKHVLTFTAVAPKGCTGSQAKLTVNVKIGIERVYMKTDTTYYYLNNKDINIKPKTYFQNTTLRRERPGYDYVIPSTQKAVYSLQSDNEELLKYITINPSNGNVKISKNLTGVFDSIKSEGDKFEIVAVANDFEGLEDPGEDYLGKDRQGTREFTLSTEGISERIKKANEIRCFIGESDYDKKRTELARTDKDSKTMTSFSIKEAQQLEFRLYDSADASDDDYISEGFTWKVTGPVKKCRAFSTLMLDEVSPGIVTITATAADGSGKGSVTRKIEIKKDSCKLGLVDNGDGEIVTPSFINNEYRDLDNMYVILPFNDEETEPINYSKYLQAKENEEWYDFTDDLDNMEHNYKVKMSGGVIVQFNRGKLYWRPTEPDTTITLINNNKGSNGKRVQEDKVYKIHNKCFDKIDSDFDKVKVPNVKVVANTYEEGKKAAKIKFEIKNLPKDKVVDIGDGHTDYCLTLAKKYNEKFKGPKPEFLDMIRVAFALDITIEDGKYYATVTQNIGGEEWWNEGASFVEGTYKLEAFISNKEYNDDLEYILNKKPIDTTVTITKNKLKAVWEGSKVTKIKVPANETDEPVCLVNADRQDTDCFKWGKNKNIGSVKITDVKFDMDTANIYKETLLGDDKLIKISTVNGNSCVAYTAEDYNAIKQAVIDAASGKTAKKNSSAQKAAAKMIKAKPDKNGNYDMNKVNPVIKGYFTYTIEGTEEMGYHTIKNLKQSFEITLSEP